jgi:hypothetical protein
VERLLVAAGAEVPDDRPAAERIPAAAALRLDFDRGRLRFLRQWYLGWRRMLAEWDAELAGLLPDRPHVRLNDPAEIAVMFDKPACIRRFAEAGIPVAEPLGGDPRDFAELRDLMLRRHSPGSFTFAAHAAFFAGFLPTPAEPGGRSAERLFALAFPGSETTGPRTAVFEAPDIVAGLAGRGYHTVCIGGTGFFNRRTPLGSVLPGLFAESHWSPELGVTEPRSTENQVALAERILAGNLRLTEAGLERSDVIGPWLTSPAVRGLMGRYSCR